MSQHVTVVFANGGTNHYHGEAMFDGSEKILVLTEMISEAVVHFNMEYLVAWITSEMTPEEEHAIREAAALAGEGDDDGGSVLGI